jgi:hypothetical protein
MKQFYVHATNESLITVDYTIVEKGLEYSIYDSNIEQWGSELRGQFIGSIINTGNGYILSDSFVKKEMDYSLFSELQILLAFIYKRDDLNYKFKFIEINEI